MVIEFNLPTNLTLLRIFLIPLLVIIFYLPWESSNIICTLIFMVAAFTDWLDGYLARKMQLETAFGAFLDPVADKLMVAIILVLIVQVENNIMLTIASAIIIGREIIIASLREWMAQIGKNAIVKVSSLGKWKTTAQMAAITLLLYSDNFLGLSMNLMGSWLLYIASILTVWSMVNYLTAAFLALKE